MAVIFEYECPHCGTEMTGSFGDNVYCHKCDKTFETDWDSPDDDSYGAWLTGVEQNGKVDLPLSDEEIERKNAEYARRWILEFKKKK